MKKIYLFLFVIFLGINLMGAQEWLTDFDQAKKLALQGDRPIVLVFSGSDWCAPCIKLENRVFKTPEFQEYAKEHYVLLRADFPRKKKNRLPETLQNHNRKLAEAYNKSGGFPIVVVLDKTGKKLGETGYKKVSPTEYLNILNNMIK